jgi:putative salt-induced outer membrane protein YdiY
MNRSVQKFHILRGRHAAKLIGASLSLTALLKAQTPSPTKATPDELILVDGERLLGQFERSNGSSVTFKSDVVGEITIDWSKIKEFHSANQFAVVPKGVKFGRHKDGRNIPQGTISVADQKVQVTSPSKSPQTFPVADTGYVITEPLFQKSLRQPALFEGWKGSATAGVSLVVATQNNRSVASAVSLTRAVPTEGWMNPESRTILNFTSAYGELTQPGQPNTKTSIYHADAEQDEYFTPSLYGFGQAAFDHNFSQGLDLQQTIGGGLGWTVIKENHEQLDLKAELTYVDQQFQTSSENQKLVGSVLSETYDRTFKRGITLHELVSISPGLSNSNAYSAAGNIVLAIPIMKRISLSLSTADTYLNNPPVGFKTNSFQFATGFTYTLP